MTPLTDPHALKAERYARDVVAGRIVACELTRLACQRYREDRKREHEDPAWPYRYSQEHAGHVCRFVERLPHVEGKWSTATIVLEPWQCFLLCNVFGWRRREGGRRFTDIYQEVARKNGKSAIVSAIGLYMLTEDEPGPQVKAAATTGDQARIVWGVAKKMAQRTKEFREDFGIETWANSITCKRNHGHFQPINAKASTQDGLNPSLVILDELHAHKDRALYDVLRSARGARSQPLQWAVTTAGYNLEGVCYEQRRIADKVLRRTIELDHVFALIYTLDEGDEPLDPRVWCKANPNLGVSISERQLAEYAETARNSADSLIEFTTKRCNVWAGSRAPWINLDKWRRCGAEIDWSEFAGRECWGALDLASTSDVTAFALVFPGDDGTVHARCRLYVPEGIVTPRTERGSVPYQRWCDEGWLTVTPGDVTDYEYVIRDVVQALDEYSVRGIAYDPWNASHLVARLEDEGAQMIEFRQGPKSYAPAMRTFERAYGSGALRHDGNPALAWMASNLVARSDVNSNLAPDKKNSEDKIDGVVALIMALGMAELEPVDGPSVYESRGLRAVG